MTQTKDSAAVLKAGEVLNDPKATVEVLKAALDDISAESRELDAQRLPEVSQALSMTQRAEIVAQHEQADARRTILRTLHLRLTDAIKRRAAADAIAGADESRAALQKALDKAEKARSEYNAATRDALAKADVIAKGREAAGLPGYDVVGATAEQVDRLQDLAEPLLEGVALKRLRLYTQLGNPSKVA